MKRIEIVLLWLYSVLQFFFFGGMLFTIITQYPNWFKDIPMSLMDAQTFYSETNPSTFFTLMAKISIPIFIILIIDLWKLKKTRNYFLIHFILFLIIGIGTFLFAFPILEEMLFNEQLLDLPISKLEALASTYKVYDKIRFVIAVVSCFFLIRGIVEFHRQRYGTLNN